MEILNMRAGLREIKKGTYDRLAEFGKCGVLISGYPGSGKSTLAELLVDTKFGGFEGKLHYTGETPYKFVPGQLTLFEQLFFQSFESSDLFLASIAGARNAQGAFGSDPRLMVVSLHCNFPTRLWNLIERVPDRMTTDRQYDEVWKNAWSAVSSLRGELWPNQVLRQAVEETKPHITIDTSANSRLDLDEAKTILYQG